MTTQIEPKLDLYLCDGDAYSEVISAPGNMYIDEEYEETVEFCSKILTVNDSVTAESVEDMLYLDTNSSNWPQLKKHQKGPLLIKSENKKPKERLKLRQNN